jgi:uncharacterized cupredoxin-like copper-binding protein
MREWTYPMGAAVIRTNLRATPRHLMLGAAALGLLVLLPACLGGSAAGGSATRSQQVNVTLHDFNMNPTVSNAKSGRVTFRVHNDAPMTHEFVVVQTNDAQAHLPISSDGLSIDEDKLHSVGEISDVQAGTTDSLHLNLPPGRYVYFCNLEGHYLGGMHGVLTVDGDA